MPSDTLHTRFEAVARAHPDHTAVTGTGGSLTYRTLDRLSDELAAALAPVVREDRLVAIRVGRGAHLPVAVLGVLKAGCGYVPVDPDYPEARRRYILDDSAARLIVTDGPCDPREEAVATAGALTVAARPAGPAPRVPDDVAYVIYTSGSTGLPKGCVVRHHNVLSLMDHTRPLFRFRSTDVWTLSHSMSFDFSVWEIWGALLYGARLVVVDKETLADPDAFKALVATEGVTVLNQVPSVFSRLDQVSDDGPAWPTLRYLIFGGEGLQSENLRAWLRRGIAPGAELINMYGITETTVHVTFCRLTPQLLESVQPGRSPIGRPLPHLGVSLRDEDGNPAPPGTPGEIWVAGEGVCACYLGRPELTAERFVDGGPGAGGVRHYRSGDWAVRDAEGDLHYIGRRDDQVKLRGFRIELGEVESAVSSFPGVRHAACATEVIASGYTILVAYVVDADERAPVDPAALNRHLAATLPAHLRPQRLRKIPHLPLGPNGKTDKSALAAMATATAAAAAVDDAPRDRARRGRRHVYPPRRT
ncbi:amino acid adenylation domain-containing protein [Streptomyces sp. NPDC000941]